MSRLNSGEFSYFAILPSSVERPLPQPALLPRWRLGAGLGTVWHGPGYVGAPNYYTGGDLSVNVTNTDDQASEGADAADAIVTFDGRRVIGTGDVRTIITPRLENGHEFKFQVYATWNQDGQPLHEIREGTIAAGDRATADFTAPEAADGLLTTRE